MTMSSSCANNGNLIVTEGEHTIALMESERTRCEVWTRVMGYHRPTSSFNIGKQSEFRDRKMFAEPVMPGVPHTA